MRQRSRMSVKGEKTYMQMRVSEGAVQHQAITAVPVSFIHENGAALATKKGAPYRSLRSMRKRAIRL